MADNRDTAAQLAYFVADVHLGLRAGDPLEREERFLSFLRDIPHRSGVSLYLLGDIWDFWYEYRDVVPREGTRVIAHLVMLVESGVQVYFCPGNHDIWTFSHFRSLGIKCIEQPYFTEICGASFCLGHGDGLGGARFGYRLLNAIFRCRFLQRCFSSLHPWLAFRLGSSWSSSNRRRHASSGPYRFDPAREPLHQFALRTAESRGTDYFVFGHFHDSVNISSDSYKRFVVLGEWISGGSPHARFDGRELIVSE